MKLLTKNKEKLRQVLIGVIIFSMMSTGFTTLLASGNEPSITSPDLQTQPHPHCQQVTSASPTRKR